MIHARMAIVGAVVTAALAITSNVAAQCKDDTDCRAGRICKQGRCVDARCTKDSECPGNSICEDRVCKPGAPLVSPAPLAPVAAPIEVAPPYRETYRTERRLMPGLYITGPVLLGSMWLTTIAVTAAVSSQSDVGRATGYASIPVFGPWVMLGSSLNTSSYTGPLVLSGLLQAAGLGITIAGFTARRDVRVPVLATSSGVHVTLVPSVGGAAAIATF